MAEKTERFFGVDTVPPKAFLPPLTNSKSYLLTLVDQVSPASDYLYGEVGALEGRAYVKVSVDGEVVAVRLAKKMAVWRLYLGDLRGLHTIGLELTDEAGNYDSTSRQYNFR